MNKVLVVVVICYLFRFGVVDGEHMGDFGSRCNVMEMFTRAQMIRYILESKEMLIIF